MTAQRVSVIVVSRDRPDLLKRCLSSLSQLLYDPFEIIVVSDPNGLAAVSAFDGKIKCVPFDEANISKARNLGISHAAGEVVAFIDDDAVAEPTWLKHLVAGFEIGDVTAVGGYVRGRNGISFQWRAAAVDHTGKRFEIPDQENPFVPDLPPGLVPKLEGTNMAIKRDVLLALGGFDPSFEYYLDETDVCLRLAAAGHRLAFVPGAQVHHGFMENATRHPNRAPKSLFQIGKSSTIFLRKHGKSANLETILEACLRDQRKRVMAYMVAGLIEPRAIRTLLESFRQGVAAGLESPLPDWQIAHDQSPFLPFGTALSGRSAAVTGWTWQRQSLRSRAATLRAAGDIVTIFLFGPSFRRHHVRFEAPGIWVQSGGLWGRSVRAKGPHLGLQLARRARIEATRCAPQRELTESVEKKG